MILNIIEGNTPVFISVTLLAKQSVGSDNGWYSYAIPASFLVNPLAGRILVFRTTEGRFAQVEILSYYQNAPANPDVMIDASRYCSFNYVYNPMILLYS